MHKGRARIMGELEFETGNIEVELAGKVVGHIVLVAAIIKNISEETGVDTTKIMKDITTALESKWMNENNGGLLMKGRKKNETGRSMP